MEGLDNLAPKLINQASQEIENIAEARIRQVINNGRQQIKKITPQIIRGAAENIYETSFRLLGKPAKQKPSELKRKQSKIFKKMIDAKITDKIYHGFAWRYAKESV